MKVKNCIVFILFLSSVLFSNGVLIVDPVIGEYLILKSSVVDVRVENQVALIKSTQTYKNTYGDSTLVTYAFPMPNGASATELRWFINNEWNTATIEAISDSTDPAFSLEPSLEFNNFMTAILIILAIGK